MGLRNDLKSSVQIIEQHLKKANKPFLPDLITLSDDKAKLSLKDIIDAQHSLNHGIIPSTMQRLPSEAVAAQLNRKPVANALNSAVKTQLTEVIQEANSLISNLSEHATPSDHIKADGLKIRSAMVLFSAARSSKSSPPSHGSANTSKPTPGKQF